MDFIFSILAALGVGSIVAAFIQRRLSISNHRQAWINALRDDLALYLKELERMHYAIGDLLRGSGERELEERKREARVAVLLVYWRIVLRLNRTEKLHLELRQKLDELQTVETAVPDRKLVESTLDLARQILKHEWEVTKYGSLAPLMIWLKTQLRFLPRSSVY